MSGLFGIAASALRANQQGLSTVSQNIANVNTEGYGRQKVQLSTSVGGGGVNVAQIERSFNVWAENALGEAQSQFGAASAKTDALGRLESAFPLGEGSLSSAFGRLQDAFSTLATSPTVRGVKTTVLEEARTVASRFQSVDRQLTSLDRQLGTEIESTVDRINTLTGQLAELNRGLSGTGDGAGLRDRQGKALADLALEVGLHLNRQDDGTVDVFLPSGQALVRGAEQFTLSTSSTGDSPFANRLTVEGNPRDAAHGLSTGRLGGLLEARAETLASLRRDLDRLAVGFSEQMNQGQRAGFTTNGNPGADLFSGALTPTLGLAAPGNPGTAALSVEPVDASALRASAYELRFDGTNAVVTRLADGETVFNDIPGNLNGELIDGLRFTVDSGALANGDRFRFEPLSGAAGRLQVALKDPEGLALNRATVTTSFTAADGNPPVFSAALTSPVALGAPLPSTGGNPPELTLVDDGTGTLLLEDDAGNRFAFTAGEPVTLEPYGLELTLSGTLADGDSITLNVSSAGAADGGQALRLSLDEPLFDDGATAVDGYAELLGSAAGAASRAELEREATELSRLDAIAFRDSQAGVNLDEEAADLLRYQQAYQAAARVVSVADTIFQSVLSVVR
jgi:flagellar hook-associated protein 1 FlgK